MERGSHSIELRQEGMHTLNLNYEKIGLRTERVFVLMGEGLK